MGGVASSKSRSSSKLVSPQSYDKSPKTQSSSKKDGSKYRQHSTVYRVSTCKYHEKCPSIKNIKHKHYTIYDLNHLTQYSHPRKHCQYGLKCKYFENVMNGSYSLPDLCHYSIYLHPISRFITSFPKNTKNDSKNNGKEEQNNDNINENYIQQSMYNSLQMPRSGEKNGLMSYKKLGIMICDGGCGSSITRGLWKCWNFKDLIWNYKYRKFKKHKDPNYSNKPLRINKKKSKKKQKQTDDFDDESHKDVQQCLITMIESVVALAGESFLIQMYDLMIKTKTYLDNDAYDDDQNDIKIELEDDIKYDNKDKKQRRNSKKRNSLLGQNKYIEAFKAEMLQTQDSNGLAEEHVVITDEERHNMEFGELLLLFSDLVRWEFALNDREYPIIKRKKKWQCPMIYGVLLGMLNDKLKLNVEKFKQKDEDNNNENDGKDNDKIYTKSKKRRLKDKRKENLRKQIFTKGCRYSNRDLFKELQINNFTYVLSIPQIKGGNGKKYSKHIDIDNDYNNRRSTSSFDDNNDDLFDNVSSIVAPNAPPSYRQNCVHYKKFTTDNFLNYEWSSLQEVAREKLHHPRHLEMGSCLEEEELLSILLLTGTRVGLDLIESHRKYRNYCKWRVLQTNLISALLKLKSHDRTPNSNQFFHGLLRQKKAEESKENKDQPYLSVNNIYLFNTFVSTTLDHRLIESSFHNKKDGALLFLDRREPVICADISWISKFPFEHEVLFAPCALTLPSPFEKKNNNINTNKNISPKYAKKYYNHMNQKQAIKNFDEDRDRVLSITEISQQQNTSKKNKKKKKNKFKKKNKKEKEERADSLAGFSLVDGRLEALSYDANDQHFLNKMTSLQSQTQSSTNNYQISVLQSDNEESENEIINPFSPSDNGPNIVLKNNQMTPTLNVNTRDASASTAIDSNLIASFLYGKTTPKGLFLYLYQQFNIVKMNDKKNIKNEELFIDEMCLQCLFQSLFVFAIQIEYKSRNNGIKPKYISKYMDDIYDFARKYSNKFIAKINEENKKYHLNTDRITENQFVDNAVHLHQLFEQFLENIIANEMSVQYKKWDDIDNKDKKPRKKSRKKSEKNSKKFEKKSKPKIPTLNTGKSEESESESDSYEEVSDSDNDNDNDNDDNNTESYEEYDDEEGSYEDEESYEDDEYYDDENEYTNDENDTNIIENVERIRAFCRGEISLLQLWTQFTEQTYDENNTNETEMEQCRAAAMNYIQFDVLVYGALAYFVCERNPNSPLATRTSLNPLIDQLRLSLLAAYDPDNAGYVTFNAFEYFGEYLLGEYSKLRGSLAETPRTKSSKNKQKFTSHSDSMDMDDEYEDINSTNVKGSNDEISDDDDNDYQQEEEEEEEEEYEPNDIIVLNSLDIMEKNARNIIEFLVNQINELNEILKKRDGDDDYEDDDDEHAENICNEISIKTQKLLYLTKEMEIHCNSLKNHNLRYKKAKLINYIDSKREEIQSNFNELIQVDSD